MIDWDRLTTLRSDIGEEDFADVAFLFVAELEETLSSLLADPDTAEPSHFHFLRGSAANLGFVGLADACSAAEAGCAAGTPPDIPEIVRIFRASLAEVSPKVPELAQAA